HQRLAGQEDLALARPLLAQQQAQEGRFATAGGSYKRAELALTHDQAEALQDDLVTVFLPDILDLNEAHALAPSYQGKHSWVRRRRPRSISQASRVIHTT